MVDDGKQAKQSKNVIWALLAGVRVYLGAVL